MKILNVFDCAGMGAIFSHELDNGSKVIQLRQLDPFGFGDFYKNTDYYNTIGDVLTNAYEVCQDYDRVVIWDMPDDIPAFNDHPDVTIFYCGSRLRNSPQTCNDHQAKRAFLTSEDLIQYKPKGIFIPIGVDRNHFKPMPSDIYDEVPFKITKTYFLSRLNEMRSGIKMHDRDKDPINYRDMPKILNQHRFYDDLKIDTAKPPKPLPFLSGTALQALACGKTVIDWKRDIITEFPEQHDSETAAKNFMDNLK